MIVPNIYFFFNWDRNFAFYSVKKHKLGITCKYLKKPKQKRGKRIRKAKQKT